MIPVDIPQVAETYGLFVALVVVCLIVLAMVCRALWLRLNEQTDARFNDHKVHAAQSAESTKTLERALDLMEARK